MEFKESSWGNSLPARLSVDQFLLRVKILVEVDRVSSSLRYCIVVITLCIQALLGLFVNKMTGMTSIVVLGYQWFSNFLLKSKETSPTTT